jgi:hypothetical protein
MLCEYYIGYSLILLKMRGEIFTIVWYKIWLLLLPLLTVILDYRGSLAVIEYDGYNLLCVAFVINM